MKPPYNVMDFYHETGFFQRLALKPDQVALHIFREP